MVSGNGLQLQIIDFNTLGFTLPKETVQSTLDDFLANLTKNFPLGIHADSVQVTSYRCAEPLLDPERHHPLRWHQDPCFANL